MAISAASDGRRGALPFRNSTHKSSSIWRKSSGLFEVDALHHAEGTRGFLLFVDTSCNAAAGRPFTISDSFQDGTGDSATNARISRAARARLPGPSQVSTAMPSTAEAEPPATSDCGGCELTRTAPRLPRRRVTAEHVEDLELTLRRALRRGEATIPLDRWGYAFNGVSDLHGACLLSQFGRRSRNTSSVRPNKK